MSEPNPKKSKSIVLVVDDEQLIRDLFQRHLAGQGFEVIVAESGEQALHYAETVRPDIVLLDITMPGMDGIQCLRQLRVKYPDLLVIMLTAVHDEQIARMALDLGACDFLTKPIDLIMLKKALQIHLVLLS